MPHKIIYIFGGAIGDALLGVQLARTLAASGSKSTVTLLSTKKSDFIRELIADVPGVEYRELVRSSVLSWMTLIGLAFSPHGVVFLEPFQDVVSRWWKIIARVATLRPGSVEVRCQSRPRPVPSRVRILSYNPKTDHLFSMVARVAPLLGARAVEAPQPSLPAPECLSVSAEPYILFHFFAGTYRRSLPLEKVRPLLLAARKQFPTQEFVLTCTHQEEAAARAMADGMTHLRLEVSPTAKKLLCLLARAECVVGIASGVTLIATHLQVPAVILCNLSDPCWLPTYARNAVLLSAPARCGCNGDKTGMCSADTAGGGVYRCLYDITAAEVIEAMRTLVPTH